MLKIKKIKKIISDYNELSRILKTIDSVVIPRKILIIGSSAIIKKTNLKDLINNFPFVIRLNGNPTLGFENYVGSKTDMCACNEIIMNSDVKIIEKIENLDPYYIDKLENTKIIALEETRIINLEKIKNKNNKIIVFPNYLNRYVRFKIISKYNLIKKINIFYANKFSIGLLIISIFIILKKKVYIAGFNLEKTKKNIDYYYQNTLDLSKTTSHNFEYENIIIKKLIDEKKVVNLTK